MSKATVQFRTDPNGTRHVVVHLAGGQFSWVTVQFDGSLHLSRPIPEYIRAEAEKAAREAFAHNQVIWEAQDAAMEAEKRRLEAAYLAQRADVVKLIKDKLWYALIDAGTVLETPDGPRLSLPPVLPDSALYVLARHVQIEIERQIGVEAQAAEDHAKAEYERGYKVGCEDTYGIEAARDRFSRLRDYNHISPAAWAELDRLPDAYLID